MIAKSTAAVVIFLFLIIVLNGCSKSDQNDVNIKPTLKIQLVADPELKLILDDVIEQLNSQKITINNAVQSDFQVSYLSSVEASKSIANGQVKPDAWISNPEWITINNNNIKNLGAPQVDCKPLFGTPIVFSFNSKVIEQIEIFPDNFNKSVLTEFFSKTGNKLLLEQPFKSSSGLSTLRALARIFDAPDTNSILSDDTIKNLQKVFANTSSYHNNAKTNLLNVAKTKPQINELTITTEQALHQAGNPNNLLTLRPKGKTIWQDFVLCRSDIDWVTAEKIKTLEILYQALIHENSQLNIAKYGYRKLLELASDSSRTVSYEELKQLQDAWQANERPLHLIIIADTSSSMSEHDLTALQESIARLLDLKAKNDLISLISIGNAVKVWVTSSNNSQSVLTASSKLETYGGSTLYDGIIEASRIAGELYIKNSNFRNGLLIITDGPDNTSKSSLSATENILEIAMRTKNLNVKLLLLNEQFLPPNAIVEVKDAATRLGIETSSVAIDELTSSATQLWRGL